MEKKLFNSRAESPAEDWGRKWICRNTNQYNLLIQINFSLLLHGILNWAGDSYPSSILLPVTFLKQISDHIIFLPKNIWWSTWCSKEILQQDIQKALRNGISTYPFINLYPTILRNTPCSPHCTHNLNILLKFSVPSSAHLVHSDLSGKDVFPSLWKLSNSRWRYLVLPLLLQALIHNSLL